MSRMAPIVSVKGNDTSQYRRLTPVECERLQGFPDGWTEGISDLQRYNCLGNSVTVNVIEAIAEKMKKDLEAMKNRSTKIYKV